MANLSTYTQANILKALLRNTAMPAPTANVYISLHTADPGQTGANEVTGGSYARVACTTGTSGTGAGAVFGAPAASGSAQASTSTAAVAFPNSTADWGVVSFWGAWDAASAGNYLFGGPIGAPRDVPSGETAPTFAIGQLVAQVL